MVYQRMKRNPSHRVRMLLLLYHSARTIPPSCARCSPLCGLTERPVHSSDWLRVTHHSLSGLKAAAIKGKKVTWAAVVWVQLWDKHKAADTSSVIISITIYQSISLATSTPCFTGKQLKFRPIGFHRNKEADGGTKPQIALQSQWSIGLFFSIFSQQLCVKK